MFSNLFDIALQRTDPVAYLPPIHFQLCFAGASRADSTTQPREIFPVTSQSRQPIFQLCQFDLKFALLRSRAPPKNIEDQTRSIDDFDIQGLFEVLCLAGRKLVVENDDVHTFNQNFFPQFLDLTLSDESCGIGPVSPLDHLIDDACAGRGSQLTQFIETVGTNEYCILH